MVGIFAFFARLLSFLVFCLIWGSSLVCPPSGFCGAWLIGPWTCTGYQHAFILEGPGNLFQIVSGNKGEWRAQLAKIRWTPQRLFVVLGFGFVFFFATAQWCQGLSFFWSPSSASEVSAPLLDWTSLRRWGSCGSSGLHGPAGEEAS